MLSSPSLTTIANEEGTDKGTIGPVPSWPAHNYTDVYEAYLSPYRESPISILEIGLGVDGPQWKAHIAQGQNASGGASIRMWYRYFNRARIFGIDINPAAFLDNDRITTRVVDQGSAEELHSFLDDVDLKTLDVVIDDGSHRPDHQQISWSTLFPRLVPGGLYFIEDLSDNGMGDGGTSRYASDSVLNTRRVFRSFAETGCFGTPHAIDDPETLARDVADVRFHCPAMAFGLPWTTTRHRARVGARVIAGHTVPMDPEFISGSETLCVIRKR